MRALGVALLLVAGLGAGAVLSAATDGPGGDDPDATEPATPASATSPRAPGELTWTAASDPGLPPLPPDVPVMDQHLGAGDAADTVAVPTTWRRVDRFANESMWHPHGYPRFTYFLRIEQVSSRHASVETLREERVDNLPENFSRPRLLEEGEDTVWFSSENDGHLQHSIIGWVDHAPEDGEADLEVAMVGRERDLPGMRDLLDAVRGGARP